MTSPAFAWRIGFSPTAHLLYTHRRFVGWTAACGVRIDGSSSEPDASDPRCKRCFAAAARLDATLARIRRGK